MNAHIRRAVAGDAALIHQLLAEMAAAEGGEIKGTAQTIAQHGFGPKPRFRVLLAESSFPLGLILYFPEYSSWRGQMGVYVQDIFVRPAARGLGLGRILLAKACQDADWNPQFLTLMVGRKNASARAFYGALGFGARGKSDPLILDGTGLAALIAP